MNKKASTESNTMFSVVELVIGISIAIMLVGLIFYGFQLLLGDDVSSHAYTTLVKQSDVLIDELDKRGETELIGTFPIQIHKDSYVLVSSEKENAICLYRAENNKQVKCHTFSKVTTITIDGNKFPPGPQDEIRDTVEVVQITVSEVNDDKFNLNYVLQ